jgi:hypothetical protein
MHAREGANGFAGSSLAHQDSRTSKQSGCIFSNRIKRPPLEDCAPAAHAPRPTRALHPTRARERARASFSARAIAPVTRSTGMAPSDSLVRVLGWGCAWSIDPPPPPSPPGAAYVQRTVIVIATFKRHVRAVDERNVSDSILCEYVVVERFPVSAAHGFQPITSYFASSGGRCAQVLGK